MSQKEKVEKKREGRLSKKERRSWFERDDNSEVFLPKWGEEPKTSPHRTG
jgi:hypothetical protein